MAQQNLGLLQLTQQLLLFLADRRNCGRRRRSVAGINNGVFQGTMSSCPAPKILIARKLRQISLERLT
jgi:hypothetical protein